MLYYLANPPYNGAGIQVQLGTSKFRYEFYQLSHVVF